MQKKSTIKQNNFKFINYLKFFKIVAFTFLIQNVKAQNKLELNHFIIYANTHLTNEFDLAVKTISNDAKIKIAIQKKMKGVFNNEIVIIIRVVNDIPKNSRSRVNRRTKKIVQLKIDPSLLYSLDIFSNESKDSIREKILKMSFVGRIFDMPEPITTDSPNDYFFNSVSSYYFSHAKGQWYLQAMQADKAWRYTKGNPNIIIGINDQFSSGSTLNEHEDFKNGVTGTSIIQNNINYGINNPYLYHGTAVASFIGANHNNLIGVTRIVPNSTLRFEYYDFTSSNEGFLNLVYGNPGVDIINMSYFMPYQSYLDDFVDVLDDAINEGVILVSGAANDLKGGWFGGTPKKYLPFAYVAPNNKGRVITVAATGLQNDTSKIYNGQLFTYTQNHPTLREYVMDTEAKYFAANEISSLQQPALDTWNYSLSINAITNSDSGLTDSFIDVAASGLQVQGIDLSYTYSGYHYYLGTSFAAPLVSGTIALMLFVNPNLTSNEVYEILTKTTDRTVALPSGEQLNTLNDGTDRIYNRFTGFGRVNAMKAVIESMPTLQSVTSSTTLTNSHYKIPTTIFVESGATLTIPAGTKLFLGENVQIVCKSGSRLLVQGNSQENVLFDRLYENLEWKGIWLQGDNNNINYARFEGGKHSIMVQSSGNMITNSVFISGWRGIDSYANQSQPGWKSYAYISNCYFEGYTSAAITAYNTQLELNSVTSKLSQNGVYASNGDMVAINNSVIQENSIGIYLNYGSAMNYYTSELNTISQNTFGVYSTGSVSMNISGYDAQWSNAIFNNTSKNAKATSSSFIKAEKLYWNASNPGIKVSRNEDYTPFISSAPAYSNGASVQKKNDSNREQLINKIERLELISQKVRQGDNKSFEYLHEIGQFAKDSKEQNKDVAKQAKTFLHSLSKENKERFGVKNVELASLLYMYSSIEQQVDPSVIENIHQIRETLQLPENKIELLFLEANTLVMLQRETEALALLETIAELKGVSKSVIADAELLKEQIQLQIQTFGVQNNANAEPSAKVVDARSALELTISAYPNPFNPSTTFQVSLKEKSNVSLQVFTILGQQMTTVYNGELTAGNHQLNLNASSWASGMYIYRYQVANKIQTGKLLLIK